MEEKEIRKLAEHLYPDNSAFRLGFFNGFMYSEGMKKVPISEWQLCPKCCGDGNLLRYNPSPFISTAIAPVCDVCNGAKILAKPIQQPKI